MNRSGKFQRINIRSYLQHGAEGVEELRDFISDFTCPRNPDVERFLKNSAVEFTKKDQSVTYLVFSSEDEELLGYFTITVKPLTIGVNEISRSVAKRLERISRLDEETQTYTTAAYLIAQLGKNYTGGANERISGAELLDLAWDVIKSLQYAAGGVIAFVEAEEHERLLDFYHRNYFVRFKTRPRMFQAGNSDELVQLLRVIK
ncbi:MAG: GNAT family acetyltransferase [Synergistaceae bacterium]|nr:GNAT family acetyltransferase [Synergistaceae bacterium]